VAAHPRHRRQSTRRPGADLASNEEDAFPSGPEYTFAAAWHPVSGTFQLVPHTSHDMFCAGQVMLEDGRVLVNGGRDTVSTTSSLILRPTPGPKSSR